MKNNLHIAAADFVYDLLDNPFSLAIARALLHPGTILILDQATSALDSATEAILLERLASKYRGHKTILMITHRECALTYADEILRID